MKIEKLAQLLHEAAYEVLKQKKQKCRYHDYTKNGDDLECENGMVDRYLVWGGVKETGKQCPRCKGTGLEPFTPWNELEEYERKNYWTQAAFIHDHLLVPMFDKIEKATTNLGKYLNDDNGEDISLGQDVLNILAGILDLGEKNEAITQTK